MLQKEIDQDGQQRFVDEDGIQAYPLMYETEEGEENQHPELSSLKPVQERQEMENHPSQVLDVNDNFNYYKYGWMKESEQASVSNYVAFGAIIGLSVSCIYFFTGTKLLRFIQFFLLKKKYEKLNIKVTRAPQADQDEDQLQTPKGQPDNVLEHLLMPSSEIQNHAKRGGLCTGLSFHSKSLMQFFTPLLGVMQIISCSKALNLPRYVILWQLVTRSILIATLTLAACQLYLNHSLGDEEKKCIMSRTELSTSYECLNEEMPVESEIVGSHKAYLFALGAVSAVTGSLIMLRVSLCIFNSYRSYLDKLFPYKQQTAALNKNDEDGVNCQVYEEGKKKKRSRKKSKSPVKKRIISPKGSSRAHDSVSSFRALLDGDTSLHPFPAHNLPAYELSSGYDSGVGQVSMSTQANLLNMSVTSQQATTARDHQHPRRGVIDGGAAPDLLPIDEDVDDEKCSPLKPRARLSEDSPFKKHQRDKQKQIIDQDGSNNDDGNYENNRQNEINIENTCSGFGKELDQQNDVDESQQQYDLAGEQFPNSVHLNSRSGLEGDRASGSKKHLVCSSPTKQSKGKISSFFDQQQQQNDLSGSRGAQSSGFHLEVEQIVDKLNNSSNQKRKKQATNGELLGDQETLDRRAAGRESRNLPSLNVASFSAVDDSTLQLETIAPIKPGSTKNNAAKNFNNFIDLEKVIPVSIQQDANDILADSVGNEEAKEKPCEIDSDSSPFVQNFEILSSDRISNSMRPDSGKRKVIKKRLNSKKNNNKLPQDFTKVIDSDTNETIGSKVKPVLLMLTVMAFIFGICLDLYFVYNLPQIALNCALLALAAAFIADLIIQLLILLVLSGLQVYSEFRSKLLLDTSKLALMTPDASELARQVFGNYKEQSALLQIEFKDEEDLLLERLECFANDDLESNTMSLASSQKVGPRDTLIKEAVTTLTTSFSDRFKVEVREQLKFSPPTRKSINGSEKNSNINTIKPGATSLDLTAKQRLNKIVQQGAEVDSSGQEVSPVEQQRKKRRLDIKAFERTQKFFAESKHVAGGKLLKGSGARKKAGSPLKRSVSLLRQSIDNIELEKLESDVAGGDRVDAGHGRSQTPQKKSGQAAKSSLMADSSNQVSQFETPRAQVSQVQLKRHSSVVIESAKGDDSVAAGQSSNQEDVGGLRTLKLKKSSQQSVLNSIELAGKLSSIKSHYLEDDADIEVGANEIEALASAGLILSSSGQSINDGDEVEQEEEQLPANLCSSQEDGLVNDGTAQHFLSQERELIQRQYSQERELNEAGKDGDQGQKEQKVNDNKYSPIFSSVNRNETVNKVDKLDLKKTEQLQQQVNEFTPVDCPADQSAKNSARRVATANNSNVVPTHRSIVSKQQSFNSPRSLVDQIQLTNEKIKNSLEHSSVYKGRRKMIMLDEAGISKQSLNFGSVQSSAGGKVSSSLHKTNKEATLSMGGVGGQRDSQVLFDDQGKPDMMEEQDVAGSDILSTSNAQITVTETSQAQKDDVSKLSGDYTSAVVAGKISTSTSAFDRLVQASKRIMKKKSSGKKDEISSGQKLANVNAAVAQARSQSQGTDTMAIMKENQMQQAQQVSNSAIFAQPFRVGSKKQQRSTSDPLSHLQNDKKVSDAEDSQIVRKEQSFKASGQKQIENKTERETDPLNAFNNANFGEIIPKNKKQQDSLQHAISIREIENHTPVGEIEEAIKILEDVKTSALKERKNSQLPSHRKKDSMVELTRNKPGRVSRRMSRQSSNISSDSISLSQASLTISDENATSKLQKRCKGQHESDQFRLSRLQDQRERLVSFLSLAQQAKSKKDIQKIDNLIAQIDETGKPLPLSRINELKSLELMASPYNQSLIAMMHVELALFKKVKELKKAQAVANRQAQSNQASKFSLPKHQLRIAADYSLNNSSQKKSQSRIGGMEIETNFTPVLLSTTGINYKPQGIFSAKSSQIYNHQNQPKIKSNSSLISPAALCTKNPYTTKNGGTRTAMSRSPLHGQQHPQQKTTPQIQHLVQTRRVNQISPLSQSFLHSSQSTTPANQKLFSSGFGEERRTTSQLTRPKPVVNDDYNQTAASRLLVQQQPVLPVLGSAKQQHNQSGVEPRSHSEMAIQPPPVVTKTSQPATGQSTHLTQQAELRRGNTAMSCYERYMAKSSLAKYKKPECNITPLMLLSNNKDSNLAMQYSGRQHYQQQQEVQKPTTAAAGCGGKKSGITELVIAQVKVVDDRSINSFGTQQSFAAGGQIKRIQPENSSNFASKMIQNNLQTAQSSLSQAGKENEIQPRTQI